MLEWLDLLTAQTVMEPRQYDVKTSDPITFLPPSHHVPVVLYTKRQ
jgi:hypothetical protein